MAKHIIVTQIGARHRYLIPRILYEHGLLCALFTDSCKYSIMGKMAYLFLKMGTKRTIFERLANRVPFIPSKFVVASDYLSIKRFIHYKSKPLLQYETIYQSLSKVFIKKDISYADCIYNMYFENIDFLKYAKSKGKTIVVDIYENPDAFSALINEIERNPEYISLSHLLNEYHDKAFLRSKYIKDLFEIADYYTVPSEFVLNALKCYSGFKQEKAFLLPYPTSIKSRDYNYRPRTHKLIWVGNDPVRKGLIYCAKAASILVQRYPDLDFKIIGSIDEKLVSSPDFKDLNFVGVLSAKELQEEYETAEAYVFPTLFEGFAGTVIEAASCGCPIITTEGAGTDMKEFPAIYIPRYDYSSIVSSVIKIFENSDFRDKLSIDTFNYSKKLSPDMYKSRLIEIMEQI